jgi:hypothetical protein
MGVDHRYAIKKLCCPGTAPSEQFKAALGVAEEAPPLWLNRGSKANGALIRSADGGMTWQQPAGGFPNHYPSMVEYIEFDPAEPDHLFVGTGGEGARDIYKVASRGRYFTAADCGDTWEQIPLRFPIIYALAIQ